MLQIELKGYYDIDTEIINPGPMRIGSLAKVNFINRIARTHNNKVISLEIHTNASRKKGWSDDNGSVVFHSANASGTSKKLARYISGNMQREIGYWINATKRGVKIGPWATLKNTSCPAVLSELGFMICKSDVENLQNPKVIRGIINAHCLALKDICYE
jgi:N-acetylmuramoyl-L-alanine amidase